MTINPTSISRPYNPVLLSLGVGLVTFFVLWQSRQERMKRPVMLPNSLWRVMTFSSICLSVFLAWGSFDTTETFLTLYFQKVQRLEPFQTSLRFLPDPIVGVVTGLMTGLVLHKVSIRWYAAIAAIIATASPLIMALARPTWSYWPGPFLAVALNPTCAGALFSMSSLLITSAFPRERQALAGAVFQTVSCGATSSGHPQRRR